MNLFDEIQKLYVHSLNGSDVQMIETMKKDYTDEEILQLFKDYPGKSISYLFKIKPKKKETPNWYGKEINEDLVTKEEMLYFIKEWREFFDSEEEYKQWSNKQMSYLKEEN